MPPCGCALFYAQILLLSQEVTSPVEHLPPFHLIKYHGPAPSQLDTNTTNIEPDGYGSFTLYNYLVSEDLVAFMPQITLPQPPAMTATNRLQAAAAMIQVTGQETDVLATHQRFIHLLHIIMMNVITQNIFKNPIIKSNFYPHFEPDGRSAPRHQPPCGTHKKNIDAVCLVWYREDTQEVLKYTCQVLANKMILNGDVAMTKDIEMLILKVLGLVWSKAIEFGKTYVKTSLLEKLKDQTDIANFFMHEHDNNGLIIRWFGNSVFERFHTNFWYMQSVSQLKHLPAATRPCQHTCMHSLPWHTIQFTGLDYCPVFNVYYEGFIEALQNTAIGPAVTAHLVWLNTQGMKLISSNQTVTSPKKIPHIFIPHADEVVVYEVVSSPMLTYGAPSHLGVAPFHLTSTAFTYGHIDPEGDPWAGEYLWAVSYP
ncbi:hypothetical protein F5J12DRAFT_783959 [Pisolithus orientalis]|uniref:uncharacterized protein n=1 Tax=Pisolithus orientalis TaxID=936130 RepID=UPI0022257D3F|nr:uncharacterized protein F5J12DRAFT_783959 [Pisolithus orientalis]KAI6002199.1 hypothetical protein F5J12DRAFT_783959 [Pisolithus orientalis]